MKKSMMTLAALMAGLSWVTPAQAVRETIATPAGEKVVHSRLVPVLMHRAVPPFLGKHVYQGRLR